MSRFARISRPTKLKPRILVAHAQPTLGKSDWSINGKITPPSEPPAAAMPVALALLTRKKCPMLETAGVKIILVPMPPSTPKTIMKCQ